MSVVRLKPTSYTITSTGSALQNPESFLNGLGPEDASNYSSYAGFKSSQGSYSVITASVKLFFSLPSDLSNIQKVTVRARIATYNNSDGGRIYVPRSGSILDGQVTGPAWSGSSGVTDAQNYMGGGSSNYSEYELTDPNYISYFFSEVNAIGLNVTSSNTSTRAVTYVSGVVIDIEYTDDKIAIGANELDSAFLGRSWIEKIYKGAALLFDKSAPPVTYTPLAYIQGTGTQYIDTGIKMNSSVNIEADAEIRQFA